MAASTATGATTDALTRIGYTPALMLKLPEVSTTGTRAPRPSMWRFSRGELLVAFAAAVVSVWMIVIVNMLHQPLPGGDFVVFYTFGHAARAGQWLLQYDWPAFHRLQVALVPASASHTYPPTYPPLVPALYAPFAFLSFRASFLIWLLFSAAMYCFVMLLASTARPDLPRAHVILSSLLFPPFVAHQVLGQSTIWPLVGFAVAWWALAHKHPVLGGIAFSLVATKPHLGIALAIILIGSRMWRVVGGITLGIAVHGVLTLIVCGAAAIAGYIKTTLVVLRNPMIINPHDPRYAHSLRTSLEAVVPSEAATIIWVVASGVFAWLMLRVWRRHESWTLRVSALLIGTLLISPHVEVYDAILLAPATLWLTIEGVELRRPALIAVVWLLSIAFLIPSARVAGIPLTIPMMAWLLWTCSAISQTSQVATGSSPILARAGRD